MLKQIKKRLPDDIVIQDETKFDFTEDEFVSILCWLKYFNEHYQEYGKTKNTSVSFPIISKRLRLDFSFYRTLNIFDSTNLGRYVIYVSANENRKKIAAKTIINKFHI